MGTDSGRAMRRVFGVLLVMAAMVIAGLPVIGAPAAEAETDELLMVVGAVNGSGLPPGRDRPVLSLLESLGFSVELLNDDDATAGAASGKDLVVISSSVVPSKIGGTFTGVTVPVVSWEGYLHDDFGFTMGSHGDTPTTQTSLTIVDDAHPIAAGYSGEVDVSTTAQRFAYAEPVASAHIVAAAGIRPVVFAFDVGDTLTTGPAPARRVGLFMDYLTAGTLTQEGMDIVAAAVDWAADISVPINVAPMVEAGVDDTITLPTNSASLDGTVSDDGLPGGPLTTTWTGPAGVTFADATSVDTTATFPGTGTYLLTLEADDGALTNTNTVTITVNPPPNTAPSVDAGDDDTITLPTSSASLDGTVSDDGLPGGPLTTTWTGPAGVTFADATSVDTTATFPGTGTYLLTLEADDGALTNTDTVTITVEAAPNDAPSVDAGSDATVPLPLTLAVLDGTVSDDGIVAPLVTTWSVLSGPAGTTFADDTSVDTTATFPGAGVYVLQLSAFDGALTTTDTVTITVEVPGAITVAYVSSRDPLPSGDRPIRDQMVNNGAIVTVVDDDALLTDYSGFDLIFLSTSVVLTKVGDHFADVAVPLITTEHYLLDDMNMASTPTGNVTSATVDIVAPGNPLAAARMGTVAFTSSATALGYAVPGVDATVIATAGGNPVYFAYDAGEEMAGGELAPARRVAFPGSYTTARRALIDYRALLNAAIAYATGS